MDKDNSESDQGQTFRHSLLSLPHVVQDIIYEYFDAKAYLALRATSKEAKSWMERYSSKSSNSTMLDKFSSIKVKILQDCDASPTEGLPATAKNFLKSNLNIITNFYIANNSGLQIYEDKDFQEFTKIYGYKIRKLQVYQYLDCSSQAEWDFFNSLTNLNELTLQNVYTVQDASNRLATRIPSCFSNLKKLTHLEVYGDEFYRTEVDHWSLNPLKFCPNLESLSYLILDPHTGINPFHFDCRFFEFSERQKEMVVFKNNFISYLTSMPVKLKELCVNHFNDFDSHFRELKACCDLHGVKLTD